MSIPNQFIFKTTIHKCFAITVLAMLLTGCSTLSVPESKTDDNVVLTPEKKQKLSNLKNWRASGKVGLRTQRSGQSANFMWQQMGAKYTIELSGPLRAGRVLLQGNNEFVTITNAQGRKTFSRYPSTALARELGTPLPVNSLRYWLKGLPDPNFEIITEKKDDQHKLRTLVQNNWSIEYLSYTQHKGVPLPKKLTLKKPGAGIRIKFIFHGWQF